MTATTDTTENPQTAGTLPPPGTYVIDPTHSSLNFVVRHLLASKVRGSFTEFEGTIVIGDSPETSSVNGTVQAASITTNQEQRDEHLRSGDFLEASTHPTLTLVSKRITPQRGERFELVADLTIRGVTKEVTFDLELLGHGKGMAPDTTVVGFEATTSIDRRDFGVSFNMPLDGGGFAVSNKVELELAIEAHAPVAA
jgi:polyisoprenoid-binding protein YceI